MFAKKKEMSMSELKNLYRVSMFGNRINTDRDMKILCVALRKAYEEKHGEVLSKENLVSHIRGIIEHYQAGKVGKVESVFVTMSENVTVWMASTEVMNEWDRLKQLPLFPGYVDVSKEVS